MIGLPGDRVTVKGGRVFLNGEMLEQSYLPSDFVTEPGSYLKEGIEMVVPADEYLVMGDNRSHSRDGREFGPIPRSNIVGRAFFKYWPVADIGLVPTVRF